MCFAVGETVSAVHTHTYIPGTHTHVPGKHTQMNEHTHTEAQINDKHTHTHKRHTQHSEHAQPTIFLMGSSAVEALACAFSDRRAAP